MKDNNKNFLKVFLTVGLNPCWIFIVVEKYEVIATKVTRVMVC